MTGDDIKMVPSYLLYSLFSWQNTCFIKLCQTCVAMGGAGSCSTVRTMACQEFYIWGGWCKVLKTVGLGFQSRLWDRITYKEWVFFPISGQKGLQFLSPFFFAFLFIFFFFLVVVVALLCFALFLLILPTEGYELKNMLNFFLSIFLELIPFWLHLKSSHCIAYQSKLLVNFKLFRVLQAIPQYQSLGLLWWNKMRYIHWFFFKFAAR